MSDIDSKNIDELVAMLDDLTSKGTGHVNLEVNDLTNDTKNAIIEERGMGVCSPNSACQIPNLNVEDMEEENNG